MTKVLHVEATTICQAKCPMCPRDDNIRQSLTLEDFKQLDINFKELDKCFFCGTFGDPVSSPYLMSICDYLREINPTITLGINTNGGIRSESWWAMLATIFNQPYDYVVFSIDGLEDTNHIYRKNVHWDIVIENATTFINTGGSAHWDMLVFEHNKHQIQQCRDMAYDLGFTWFRTKETNRWDIYAPDDILQPVSEIIYPDTNSNVKVCEKDRDESVYVDAFGKIWDCCFIAGSPFIDKNTVCSLSCGDIPKSSQWKTEEQLR